MAIAKTTLIATLVSLSDVYVPLWQSLCVTVRCVCATVIKHSVTLICINYFDREPCVTVRYVYTTLTESLVWLSDMYILLWQRALCDCQIYIYHSNRALCDCQICIYHSNRALCDCQMYICHSNRALCDCQICIYYSNRVLCHCQMCIYHSNRALCHCQICKHHIDWTPCVTVRCTCTTLTADQCVSVRITCTTLTGVNKYYIHILNIPTNYQIIPTEWKEIYSHTITNCTYKLN